MVIFADFTSLFAILGLLLAILKGIFASFGRIFAILRSLLEILLFMVTRAIVLSSVSSTFNLSVSLMPGAILGRKW
ncbi:hypothetical protein FZW96_07870 [Bacillus sp. BGMRC 2118]|nr:hypothetical protein FZW96_07870 [Bacillus sp. BGMRC 2118]